MSFWEKNTSIFSYVCMKTKKKYLDNKKRTWVDLSSLNSNKAQVEASLFFFLNSLPED